jgi:hypothetical protein
MKSLLSVVFAAALALLLPATASAYTVETLQQNGPSSNRIDLLILGDGYTSSEQAQMTAQANTALNDMFAIPPYSTYRSLFNVKLVHVISNQSGADFGTAGGLRDTALAATYNCNGIDRLICVDNGAAYTVAAQHVPEYDFVVVLVNDVKYGGSGGGLVVISNTPGSGGSGEILKHELGHQMSRLADEYEDPYPGFPSCDPASDCPEPNATLRTSRAAVKWNAWINASTPVPTPEGSFSSAVGVYEGARYMSSGVYRPVEFGCLMRELNAPFCPVCREAMIRSFWNGLRIIESRTPADSISLSACSAQTFSVTSPAISPSPYVYRWSVDGAPRTGNLPSFTVAAGSLAPGSHTLVVDASDATTHVRNDPEQALQERQTWTVNVTACATGALQAETATLAGGTLTETTNAGYNGTGYVNFPANGGTLTFNNVAGAGGGSKTLEIRYALAGSTARAGTLTVNGVSSSISFAPTGSFSTWQTLTRSITLNNNTTNIIRFASTGADLGNIDQIAVLPAAQATIYPAENATRIGGAIVETVNAGYLGSGYINPPTTSGGVSFTNVTGNGGGSKAIAIRYALGATASRSGSLVVNGVTTPITVAPSGAWTTWATHTVTVTLNNTTTNNIQLLATGSDFGNIDQITVP